MEGMETHVFTLLAARDDAGSDYGNGRGGLVVNEGGLEGWFWR
jgi:hypothetical protein